MLWDRSFHNEKLQSVRPSLEELESRVVPANYTVNLLTDTTGSQGVGVGNGLIGDLRYCVEKASTNNDQVNTIRFDAATTDNNLISLTARLRLKENKTTNIIGNGVGKTMIQAVPAAGVLKADEIFLINDKTAIVSLLGIKFTNGRGNVGLGGAIVNGGTLAINNCLFQGNRAEQGGAIFNSFEGQLTVTGTEFRDNMALRQGMTNPLQGGAIFNTGLAVVRSSKFQSNTSDKDGGAIFNGTHNELGVLKKGVLTVEQNCQFTANTATNGDGGAIGNDSDAMNALTIKATTLSGNKALKGAGGGVSIRGNATIDNTTVANNEANKGGGIAVYKMAGTSTTLTNVTNAANQAVTTTEIDPEGCGVTTTVGEGGGLYVEADADVEVYNSIIAQNFADWGPDVAGAVDAISAYNLIGDDTGSTGFASIFAGGTNLVGTSSAPIDPLLNPLGDYGGGVETMTLAANSPARDFGSLVYVISSTDERGYSRFVDGFVDLGAVEMQPEIPVGLG